MFRTKNLQFVIVVFAAFAFTATGFASSQNVAPQTEQKVRDVIEAWNARYKQRDIDGMLKLLHPGCEEPPKEFLRHGLHREFEIQKEPQKTEYSIRRITAYEDKAAAWVSDVKFKGEKKERSNVLYVFKPYGGEFLISGLYEQLDSNDFDVKTGVYKSNRGKFSLRIPEGWIPLKGVWLLRGLTPESVTILAPDLESKVMMGLVQLPLKLGPDDTTTAQKAVEADTAVEKRESLEYLVHEQGPVSLAGLKGYKLITEFEPKEKEAAKRKRMRAYFSDSPMLYFFICDALDSEKFDSLLPRFEAIMESLSMLPVDEELTRQEAVAAEQAKGSVAGRVYSSKEYNCFIAAPAGWEVRTSPNPAHLVEMQYAKGRSIARLIAASGLKPTDKINEVFTQRLNAVKEIVQNFSESSRKDLTISGTPAIESVHKYYLEGLGQFYVKEVSLIRNGKYYLILCQCIEPDDFKVLERDFDKIIESFGFIQ
jgi:hypothetical protein